MDESEVDFAQLVELLLADFDGSEREAAQIRRAVLKAARHIAPERDLWARLDRFTEDLTVAEISIGAGAPVTGWRAELLRSWRALRVDIRQSLH